MCTVKRKLLTGGFAPHFCASGGDGEVWAWPNANREGSIVHSIVFFFLFPKIKQLKMQISPHFSAPKDTPGY